MSIYTCSGHREGDGCNSMGVLIHDNEDDDTLLYGCIEEEKHVEVEELGEDG